LLALTWALTPWWSDTVGPASSVGAVWPFIESLRCSLGSAPLPTEIETYLEAASQFESSSPSEGSTTPPRSAGAASRLSRQSGSRRYVVRGALAVATLRGNN